MKKTSIKKKKYGKKKRKRRRSCHREKKNQTGLLKKLLGKNWAWRKPTTGSSRSGKEGRG